MNEILTTPPVRKMISAWLTGDDERDVKTLSRVLRALRFTRAQWRKVIAETKEAM